MVYYLNLIKSYFASHFLTIPISPLVVPIIGYLVGIAGATFFRLSTIFVLGTVITGSTFFLRSYRILIFTFIGPILLGCLLFHRQQYHFNTFNATWDNTHIDIRAMVQDISHTHDKYNPYVVTLSCTNIKDQAHEQWQKTNVNLFLYCRSKPSFDVADFIEITQLHYKKPHGSYALYLLKEGIVASLFTQQLQSSLIHHPPQSFSRVLYHYRQQMIEHFKNHMSASTFALFAAIFCGNKVLVKKELENYKTEFQIWGISHYLARSGLHMVIITMLLISLMSLLPLHITYKRSFIIAISIGYHLLSWPSISFLRSLYTVILYYLCNILYVPIYALHLFCVVCLLVLLVNPAQVLFLDFQLSFGLTFALAWFNQITAQRRLLNQNY